MQVVELSQRHQVQFRARETSAIKQSLQLVNESHPIDERKDGINCSPPNSVQMSSAKQPIRELSVVLPHAKHSEREWHWDSVVAKGHKLFTL